MPLEKITTTGDWEIYEFKPDEKGKEVIAIKFGKIEVWMSYDDPGILIVSKEPIKIKPENSKEIRVSPG